MEKPEKSSPVQMTSRPDSVYLKDVEFLQDNRFWEILPVELTRPICRGSGILTTGMRRVVSLARTMLRRPEIVLFDEVTAGLDSHTEQVILNYICQLSQNKICIMISHKPEDGIYAKEIIQIKSLA